MLTVIVKRTDEPNVVQFTQELVMRELAGLHGSEMLLEDSWTEGLKKVRTPFVCLVEPDCIFGIGSLATNLNIFGRNIKGEKGRGKGGGGYTKLALLAPTLCLNNFTNRIYGYSIGEDLQPDRERTSSEPYHVQVASILGAIIRYSAIKTGLHFIDWDDENIPRLSTELSLYLWGTGRRIKVNPVTEYVSSDLTLAHPLPFAIPITAQVQTLFDRNFDILNNPKVKLKAEL